MACILQWTDYAVVEKPSLWTDVRCCPARKYIYLLWLLYLKNMVRPSLALLQSSSIPSVKNGRNRLDTCFVIMWRSKNVNGNLFPNLKWASKPCIHCVLLWCTRHRCSYDHRRYELITVYVSCLIKQLNIYSIRFFHMVISIRLSSGRSPCCTHNLRWLWSP